jgi:hypothetical protein
MRITQTMNRLTSSTRVRVLAVTFAGFLLAIQSAIVGASEPSLRGFATSTSISPGQTVRFKVETDASAYSITIYQLGDGGGGAQLVASLPTPPGPQVQPPCVADPSSGVVDCSGWSESASWTVPTTAAPGVYDALLQRSDTTDISHIVFVVSDEPGTTEE